jgi:hypothetical protein
MIDYKYNKIVQHGGDEIVLLFGILIVCVIFLCLSADLDTFAGGIFRFLKIPIIYDIFKSIGDFFKKYRGK